MNLLSTLRITSVLAVTATLLPLASQAAAKTWNVDKDHASVSFEINHFFTPVKARFLDFAGTFKLDASDLTKAPSFEFTVKVPSVATDNAKRDGHLQSPDFFNAAQWPEIRFTGTQIVKTGDNTYKAIGKLTIRDVTKAFEVPFTVLGVKEVTTMMGAAEIMGIRVKTEINRNDFGVGTGSWAATAVVGDTVGIDILMELK